MKTSTTRKRKGESKESADALRLECAVAGSYYWLRAEGPDENLVSALNRAKYRTMIERFRGLSIPEPTDVEMYVIAAERWPKHKLHAAPSSK